MGKSAIRIATRITGFINIISAAVNYRIKRIRFDPGIIELVLRSKSSIFK